MIKKLRKLGPAQSALIIGILTALALSTAFSIGILEPLELKTLDHRFDKYAGRLTPSEDIVIVTIDQNSIDYLKNNMQILWKWPRDVYAYTIDYLTRSGASAVLLDLTFQDPDINRAEFEEGQTDIMLGKSIERSGVVITSSLFVHDNKAGEFSRDTTDYETLTRFAVGLNNNEAFALKETFSIEAPITPIMEKSRFVGASNIFTEVDGVIRQLGLIQKFNGSFYPSTALATVMTMQGAAGIQLDSSNTLLLGASKIPIGSQADIYLNWYGPGGPGPGEKFRYYPIANVFLSELQVQDGHPPHIPDDVFRDKIVLIGSNAPSLYDLKPTPMSGHGPYPGVEILATAINNLLDSTALKRESSGRAIFTIILVCMLLAIGLSRTKSPFKSVPILLGSLVALYIYAIISFYDNVFINMVPAGTGIILTFVAITLMNYLTEGKEKARVKKAFSQYTSSALMDEILKNPEMLKLGGEKRDLSILFSDIRGFTSISEKLEPEQLTNMLNNYLTPMTDVVFKHNGILDKYIGDAIMAIFGAPLPLENHPSAACRAALDMLHELESLRQKWRSDGMPDFIQGMRIGIGINSGPVSVGNMGSNLRFDYTVIGDNVNLSSRLEGTTKAYGVNIIASQYTWERTKNEFIYRELDYIRVVGKQVPIRIYELLGIRKAGALQEDLIAKAEDFESALSLYRDRKWEEAAASFNSLVKKSPEDMASEVYINRCEQFIEDPPGDDWDRVFERRSK